MIRHNLVSGNSKIKCVDPGKILKIRKDKNCTDNCIPTIFSSLFDASIFKECPDFDSHFCALEDLFSYVYERVFQCSNSGVEKYFEGTLDVGNGISYTNFLNNTSWNNAGNDEERSRTLLAMKWIFTSPYVTDSEVELVYDAKDLVAWLGGTIGLFVGYSIYDLFSQIIDLVFNSISRFTNTKIQNLKDPIFTMR